MHSCEDPEGAEAGGVPAWLPDCLLCQAQIQLNTGAEIPEPNEPKAALCDLALACNDLTAKKKSFGSTFGQEIKILYFRPALSYQDARHKAVALRKCCRAYQAFNLRLTMALLCSVQCLGGNLHAAKLIPHLKNKKQGRFAGRICGLLKRHVAMATRIRKAHGRVPACR